MGIAFLTLQLLLIGLGLVYFCVTMSLGWWFWRRGEDAREQEEMTGPGRVPLDVYVLIPCLNEEQVIGATVRRLVADERTRVVVVDDGSDDSTRAAAKRTAVRAGARHRMWVHRRNLPAARLGKGPALNAGFRRILKDVAARGLDPEHVVVCVMDADGRLSAGALDEVLPLFADSRVGGVQLAVRIRNRGALLTGLQDMEFWALSGVSQFGRAQTGTVSLGGNGQFTRLSALLGIGENPWAPALTEDLELSLELSLRGWRLTTTTRAWVDQQGVTSLKRLVRQRTRWFQGHMAAGRYIPRIWTNHGLSHWAALELMLYLLVPWMLVLPWAVIFSVTVLVMLHGLWVAGIGVVGPSSLGALVQGLLLWYLMSFGPNLVAAFLYSRRPLPPSRSRCLLMGHLLVAANCIAYTACWLALVRNLRGHTSWAKTQRVLEPSLPRSRNEHAQTASSRAAVRSGGTRLATRRGAAA